MKNQANGIQTLKIITNQMPKNNCKQCEENAKWRILGTDCSQAIFDTKESCENYKEGYGQSTEEDEMSNFDLLFGGGTQVEIPEYGDEDYVNEGEVDPSTGEGGDSSVDEDNNGFEGDTSGDNTSNDGMGNNNGDDGWSVDPDEPPDGCPDVDGKPQIWNSYLKKCIPLVVDEEEEDDDDEEDDNKCEGVDCGPNGVCVDGLCTCPEEDEELDPTTGKCVKKIIEVDEEEDYNAFTLPGDYELSGSAYEVPKDQERSVLALAMSFNPTHTTNWKGHPNKDLPVWEAGHVQPGNADPDDDLKGKGRKGKDAKINPILHELFCGGNPNSSYKSSIMDYGGKPWSDRTARHSVQGKSNEGINHKKTSVRGHYCFPKNPASKTNRWSQCNVHNIVGSSGGNWLFCAYGIACTADLFVMKYWNDISAGKMPGGQQSWEGSTGAKEMVKYNAKNTTGIAIGYYENERGGYRGKRTTGKSSLKNCLPCESIFTSAPSGIKAAGPMLDTQQNRELLNKLANMKGALYTHFGHIGMVVGILGKSHPPTASFITLEFNVGAGLRFQRHPFAPGAFGTRTRQEKKYNVSWLYFADTTPLLGGSWAPKGLGNTDYLKAFLGDNFMPYFNDGGGWSKYGGSKWTKMLKHGDEWNTKDKYAKGYALDLTGPRTTSQNIVNNQNTNPGNATVPTYDWNNDGVFDEKDLEWENRSDKDWGGADANGYVFGKDYYINFGADGGPLTKNPDK